MPASSGPAMSGGGQRGVRMPIPAPAYPTSAGTTSPAAAAGYNAGRARGSSGAQVVHRPGLDLQDPQRVAIGTAQRLDVTGKAASLTGKPRSFPSLVAPAPRPQKMSIPSRTTWPALFSRLRADIRCRVGTCPAGASMPSCRQRQAVRLRDLSVAGQGGDADAVTESSAPPAMLGGTGSKHASLWGVDPAAASGRQPGQIGNDGAGDVEHGSIGAGAKPLVLGWSCVKDRPARGLAAFKGQRRNVPQRPRNP